MAPKDISKVVEDGVESREERLVHAEEFLASPEGKEMCRRARAEGEEWGRELRRMFRVREKDWHVPVTLEPNYYPRSPQNSGDYQGQKYD